MGVGQPSEAHCDALSQKRTRFFLRAPDLVVVTQMKTHIRQLRQDEREIEKRRSFLDAKIRELADQTRAAALHHKPKPEQQRSTTDNVLSHPSETRHIPLHRAQVDAQHGRRLMTMPASPAASSFFGRSFLGGNFLRTFLGTWRLSASSSMVPGVSSSRFQNDDPDTETDTMVDEYEDRGWKCRDSTLDYLWKGSQPSLLNAKPTGAYLGPGRAPTYSPPPTHHKTEPP